MRYPGVVAAVVIMAGVLAVALPAKATPPVLLEHPRSQTVRNGETVQFSVIAEGISPLTYQWRFDGAPLSNATNSTLILSNVQPAQSGLYSVLVANSTGTNASDEAFLRVCWEVQFASFDQIP